ncbi:hypothetical protein A628_04689 [Salmonella enterica subsp. enterica serovar Cubana str. 76814]|uniref:Uncharacterized protein n=1 Tax=Salmonella enterica subsp. enterica serovar Cubana str. 76814 TaxID=1192560 RepID=V7IJ20_SALET|nr:hypothetical protein A628_04689 [Salmonella enterica subsp. enterica serovar Cubana str. 76814]
MAVQKSRIKFYTRTKKLISESVAFAVGNDHNHLANDITTDG